MPKLIIHVGRITSTLEAETPTLAVAEVFKRAGDLYDEVLTGQKDVKLAVTEETEEEDGE